MAEKSTETLTKLIELLEPLEEKERKRTVDTAMLFLKSHPTEGADVTQDDDPYEQEDASQLPDKAAFWLKRSKLKLSDLEEVFHFEGDEVEVIAPDVPDSGSRAKTQQCYILLGIKNLLQTGQATIDDKEARNLCDEMGCYDSANHAKAVKDLGNQVTGDKDKGFTLTAPGLRAGAELLKQMTATES